MKKSRIAKPMKYITPKGDEINLLTTGQVSELVGRTKHQIIRWECSGILPRTFFIYKNNYGVTSRLYSEEQVDVLKRELLECQVMSGRRTPDKFKRHLHKEFKRLAIKYGLLDEGGNPCETDRKTCSTN